MEFENNNKKNIVDNILIGVMVISLILLITFHLIIDNDVISGMILYFIFLILFFVVPLHEYIKKRLIMNMNIIRILIIRVLVGIIFSVSYYQIFFTNNYNLKYTYWVCFFSFVFTLIYTYTEQLVNEYKERKIKGKKHNELYIIGSVLLILILMFFQGYKTGMQLFQSKRELILTDVKVPEHISILKYNSHKSKTNSGLESIDVWEPSYLRKITMDLELQKIQNINSTDLLNYERMIDGKSPYYMIIFSYEGTSSINDKLKNGYIDFIKVTSNNNIVIKNIRSYDSIFGEEYYEEIYPINLSKETVDMLYSYLGLIYRR